MYNFFKTLAVAVWLSYGIGCGGGGGASVEDFSITPEAPDLKSISGTIQGLTGSLTLDWGTGSRTISGTTFAIPLAFEAEDDLSFTILNEPLSQTCTIDTQTTFNNQTTDIGGVEITCITQNLIRVSVENFFTGTPLSGISVTAIWNDQGMQQSLSVVSDAQGLITFEVPLFDGRIMINADPVDFGEQSKIVWNTATPTGRTARMLMQPVVLGTAFDSTLGTDLTVGTDILLSIPANALVDENDNPYSGSVTTEFTVIDPSLDVELMPGDYTSRDSGGATAPIQSYGALSVTFTGANSEVLDLATGQVADINIPVAESERTSAPISTPLFYYDPITGYWTEEGQANLMTLASGLVVYSSQVSHFTTWNADEEYVPVMLNGCVVNSMGAPFASVRVDASGATYVGSSRAVADANGNFSLPVRPLSGVLVTVGDGLQSGTQLITSGSVDFTVTECLVASAGSSTVNLTWGENPSDLDTRLYGFSDTNSSDDFEVNFTQRSVTVNNLTIELDVDDVTGFGPEVVTFPDFPFPGVYRYAVHLFSGTSTIQASPARVELNIRGTVSVFTPPSGTPTECWSVFDIEVDEFGNALVLPLNDWELESYCTAGAFSNPTGLPPIAGLVRQQHPSNPLTRLVERKYYAD